MTLRYLGLGLLSAAFLCGPVFAQDDLFTIDESEVQSSWKNEALDTEVSKIAIPSLLTGRKAPVMTQAGHHAFEQEASALSRKGPDDLSMRTGNMLISMGFQGHVRNATPPSWFEIYYPDGNIKELSAERPERQNGSSGRLEGKGFTSDGYFAADHIVSDITYARYYFKIIKDGRPYFQPINNIDPAKKTVTLWQKVKTNIDAHSQYQIAKARKDEERREKEKLEKERRLLEAQAKPNTNSNPAETSTNQFSTYSPPKPKFFTGDFGRAPLSKDMQEIVDAGKGQVEGVYETQRQCRLVEDNDEVFIRSKKVCEDVQVLVGTRPVR